MRFLLCLAQQSGAPVPQERLLQFAAAPCCKSVRLVWHEVEGLSIVLHRDLRSGPSVACSNGLVGVGDVRLDNREDLARAAGTSVGVSSDLELLLQLIARKGERCIADAEGDFSVVVWEPSRKRLLAATDPFGVRRLYYHRHAGLIAIASRAELLAMNEEYDRHYLTALLAKASLPADRTAYVGVAPVPPGTIVRLSSGAPVVDRFWDVKAFEPTSGDGRRPESLAEQLRELLASAIRSRLDAQGKTWSTLSGGLDSSSIVCLAQALAADGRTQHGLGGTITWVDTRGSGGDERVYSDAVVQRWRVRNEQVVDYACLHDDGASPPYADQPHYNYPFYARDRRTGEIVRQAGGEVLLSGYGGDNLFIGNMFFFADWIAGGQVRKSIREMVHRAALGRTSFWQLAYRNALLPLVPNVLRRTLLPEQRAPVWVPAKLLRQYGLNADVHGVRAYAGRVGHKYADYVACGVMAIPEALAAFETIEQFVEMRHPYLYRPLVEFALRLPPDLCVQANERKWILREAMAGVLPEPVRRRVGKGTVTGSVAWSIAYRKELIQWMLQDPLVAQLGCVDGGRLRAVIASGAINDPETNLDIGATIAVEMWLRVRVGQWSARPPVVS